MGLVSAFELCRVALLGEVLENLLFEVTLNKDFTVLDRTAYATECFQLFAELFQIVVSTNETSDKGDSLSSTAGAVDGDPKLLLRRGQSFMLFHPFISFILKIGVGGIDHIEALFPIVVHNKFVNRETKEPKQACL